MHCASVSQYPPLRCDRHGALASSASQLCNLLHPVSPGPTSQYHRGTRFAHQSFFPAPGPPTPLQLPGAVPQVHCVSGAYHRVRLHYARGRGGAAVKAIKVLVPHAAASTLVPAARAAWRTVAGRCRVARGGVALKVRSSPLASGLRAAEIGRASQWPGGDWWRERIARRCGTSLQLARCALWWEWMLGCVYGMATVQGDHTIASAYLPHGAVNNELQGWQQSSFKASKLAPSLGRQWLGI